MATPNQQHRGIGSWLVVIAASFAPPACRAADLEEIVRRAGDAIKADWAAHVDYSWLERDEVQQNGKLTSKTYQAVMMAGSDYYVPVATNDQPLSDDQKKAEREKLRAEFERRNSETPEARRERLENFRKQSAENDALVVELPSAFNFALAREETMNGYAAYVLSATPGREAVR